MAKEMRCQTIELVEYASTKLNFMINTTLLVQELKYIKPTKRKLRNILYGQHWFCQSIFTSAIYPHFNSHGLSLFEQCDCLFCIDSIPRFCCLRPESVTYNRLRRSISRSRRPSNHCAIRLAFIFAEC